MASINGGEGVRCFLFLYPPSVPEKEILADEWFMYRFPCVERLGIILMYYDGGGVDHLLKWGRRLGTLRG